MVLSVCYISDNKNVIIVLSVCGLNENNNKSHNNDSN